MWLFIKTLFLGFTSNIKIILISVLGLSLVFGAAKLYYSIVENVENRIKVQQLEQAIKDKEDLLKKQEIDILNRDLIITERDSQLKDLEEKYKDITENLGDDENDPAPKSLQQLMERLNKK